LVRGIGLTPTPYHRSFPFVVTLNAHGHGAD
jgi:hypothetical protein